MPAATVIVPLAFTVKAAVGVEVKVMSAGFSNTPFKVSFANTDGVLAPGIAVKAASVIASMATAVTVTVVTTVSQLVGFKFSQIVYAMV